MPRGAVRVLLDCSEVAELKAELLSGGSDKAVLTRSVVSNALVELFEDPQVPAASNSASTHSSELSKRHDSRLHSPYAAPVSAKLSLHKERFAEGFLLSV